MGKVHSEYNQLLVCKPGQDPWELRLKRKPTLPCKGSDVVIIKEGCETLGYACYRHAPMVETYFYHNGHETYRIGMAQGPAHSFDEARCQYHEYLRDLTGYD